MDSEKCRAIVAGSILREYYKKGADLGEFLETGGVWSYSDGPDGRDGMGGWVGRVGVAGHFAIW